MSKNVNFTANQLKFIDWLAQTKYDRKPTTQALLAQELGVRPETLSRWRQIPELTEAVTKRARDLLGDDLPEIYGALRREAAQGSFQHIKLSLELSGEYVERQQVQNINIDVTELNDDELERIANGEEPLSVVGAKSQS